MDKVFERFAREEDGNAVIDWTVLLAGVVLLTISVLLTITGTTEKITDDTMDRVESMEDWLPS